MSWDKFRKANPWRDLPASPPYVLREDASAVGQFNNRNRGSSSELQLHVLPETFIGSLDAPVWLLNLNPGFGGGEIRHDAELHRQQLEALNLEGAPFWMLAEHNSHTGAYRWWDRKLREPIRDFGRTKVRETFFCAELYGYHSETAPKGFEAPSQRFSFDLVRAACAAQKTFVFMRAKSAWLRAVPELASAKATQVRSWRQPTISSGNLVNWELIAGVLRS